MRLYRPKPMDAIMPNPHGHWLPFLVDHGRWLETDDISQADVIPLLTWHDLNEQLSFLTRANPKSWILKMNCYHMNERQDADANIEYNLQQFGDLGKRIIVVHTNIRTKSHRHAYNDIMWNRHKLYLTEYDRFDLSHRIWSSQATSAMYKLYDLSKLPYTRKYLSPTRVYPTQNDEPRMVARRMLIDTLARHEGWLGDPKMGDILAAQEMEHGIADSLISGHGGHWWPVAEDYYRSSYVSIYVETVVHFNDTNIISEKSLDPLIQGHFILPFGPKGLIEDIRRAGFKLPDWIDYSYDDIEDPSERLQSFLTSVDDVCSLSTRRLHAYWLADQHILMHNRDLIWTRPYHSLYDGVSECIQRRTS